MKRNQRGRENELWNGKQDSKFYRQWACKHCFMLNLGEMTSAL